MFAFDDTSGVGAWKRGEGFNTTPDSAHYLCFCCAKAWKQRLDGPLTPDVVGELAFFCCRESDCGEPLSLSLDSVVPSRIQLECARGHQHAVQSADGGLILSRLPQP
ncbi:MAG: hypothetical protein ABIW19_00615 [Vicinamibacterales bacterium]